MMDDVAAWYGRKLSPEEAEAYQQYLDKYWQDKKAQEEEKKDGKIFG